MLISFVNEIILKIIKWLVIKLTSVRNVRFRNYYHGDHGRPSKNENRDHLNESLNSSSSSDEDSSFTDSASSVSSDSDIEESRKQNDKPKKMKERLRDKWTKEIKSPEELV